MNIKRLYHSTFIILATLSSLSLIATRSESLLGIPNKIVIMNTKHSKPIWITFNNKTISVEPGNTYTLSVNTGAREPGLFSITKGMYSYTVFYQTTCNEQNTYSNDFNLLRCATIDTSTMREESLFKMLKILKPSKIKSYL